MQILHEAHFQILVAKEILELSKVQVFGEGNKNLTQSFLGFWRYLVMSKPLKEDWTKFFRPS